MMKKAIAAVIAALMILPSAGLTSAAEEAALSFGDPNGDGNIDAKDASFILAAYSRLSTGEEGVLTAAQSTAADVRTDGNVDAKDASAILAYYAYLSTGGTLDLTAYTYGMEYSLEAIKTDVEAFSYYADKLREELYAGNETATRMSSRYGGTVTKCPDGATLLALLNIDEISSNVLKEYFEDYTDEEIYLQTSEICKIMATEYDNDTNIDFNDYMFDKTLATEFNELKSMAKDYIDDDCPEYADIIDNYEHGINTKFGTPATSSIIKQLYIVGTDAYVGEITRIKNVYRLADCDYHLDRSFEKENSETYKLMDKLYGKVYSYVW